MKILAIAHVPPRARCPLPAELLLSEEDARPRRGECGSRRVRASARANNPDTRCSPHRPAHIDGLATRRRYGPRADGAGRATGYREQPPQPLGARRAVHRASMHAPMRSRIAEAPRDRAGRRLDGAPTSGASATYAGAWGAPSNGNASCTGPRHLLSHGAFRVHSRLAVTVATVTTPQPVSPRRTALILARVRSTDPVGPPRPVAEFELAIPGSRHRRPVTAASRRTGITPVVRRAAGSYARRGTHRGRVRCRDDLPYAHEPSRSGSWGP